MKKLLCILVLFFSLSLSLSFADSDIFTSIDNDYRNMVKIGDYTFNFKTNLFKVYDKSGKNLLITVYEGKFYYPGIFFVNGKNVYYEKNVYDMKTDKLSSSIIQIDLATKKSKSIKNFNNIIAIQAIKGNDLYYNVDIQKSNNEVTELRVLNLSNLSDKLVKVGATRVQLGKNKIFYMGKTYDPSPTTLHSMDYNYKNPKLISPTVVNYILSGGKVYYADDKDFEVETLYVCNEDGSGKKALTDTIYAYIYHISPDEIRYSTLDGKNHHKMNLKTKKKQALPNKIFQ